MIRRTAALFAMLAFALSWLVGVWCGHAPGARLPAALVGLVAGALAGAGIGIALEKIVLARLAEQWREIDVAPPAEKAARAPATARAEPKPQAAPATSSPGTPAASARAAKPGTSALPEAAMAEALR